MFEDVPGSFCGTPSSSSESMGMCFFALGKSRGFFSSADCFFPSLPLLWRRRDASFTFDHVYRSVFNLKVSAKCSSRTCFISRLCVFIMAGMCLHQDDFPVLLERKVMET